MKIHFGGTSYGIDNYLDDYVKIRGIILGNNMSLTRDWLGKDKNTNIDNLMTANEKSIVACDAVILDASYDSYAMGFQLAVSAIYKKPVLLISNRSMSDRVSPLTLINHKDKRRIHLAEYTDQGTLETAILDFLGWVKVHNKNARFNIELDHKLDSYLTMKARTHRTNKAHEIRLLIQADMDQADS